LNIVISSTPIPASFYSFFQNFRFVIFTFQDACYLHGLYWRTAIDWRSSD